MHFIVGIIGICGNTLALFVLWRKREHDPTNFYSLMLCLSVFDLSYIFMALITFSLRRFSSAYEEDIWNYILPLAIPVLQVTLTGSIYCTIAITLERYFVICQPFYRIAKGWRPRTFLVPIAMISILYNIPKFLEFQTCELTTLVMPNDNNTVTVNSTIYCSPVLFLYPSIRSETNEVGLRQNNTIECRKLFVDFTNLRLDRTYVVYSMCSNLLINAIVPFIFIITLNSLIVKKMRTHIIPPSNECMISMDEMEGKDVTIFIIK